MFFLLLACTDNKPDSPAGDSYTSGDSSPLGGDSSPTGGDSSPTGGDSDTAPDETQLISGFSTPEGMLYDPVGDVYIVSNINGSPSSADDNGFLSRMTPDGAVETWVDGAGEATLNAPKGMTIVGDVLYVTDVDHVRSFDRTSGAALESYAFEGAGFLNDLTHDDDGVIYVTDTSAGEGDTAIWALTPDGTQTPFVSGDVLASPNGICWTGSGFLVVSQSSLYVLDPTGAIIQTESLPAGQLDGVLLDNSGRVLASSWQAQAVFGGSLDGSWEAVVEGVTSPADIGYDTARDRLLIPLFQEDQVQIQPL